MAKKNDTDYTDYTDPQLRARLKDEIQAGDRGGKPGQWSARKAQLLVKEYEKAGGGYTHAGHRSEGQRHLQRWQEQDWHTAGGDADARGDDGTARYLPDVAWKLLSEREREETERLKKGSDDQFVANTDAAKGPAGPPSCSPPPPGRRAGWSGRWTPCRSWSGRAPPRRRSATAARPC